MSEIVNEPRRKGALVRHTRALIENRARWLAHCTEETEKRGTDPRARAVSAVFRCGEVGTGKNPFGRQR